MLKKSQILFVWKWMYVCFMFYIEVFAITLYSNQLQTQCKTLCNQFSTQQISGRIFCRSKIIIKCVYCILKYLEYCRKFIISPYSFERNELWEIEIGD